MKSISRQNSIFYQFNSSLQLKAGRKILPDFTKIINTLIQEKQQNIEIFDIKILEIGAGSGNLTFLILDQIVKFANKYQTINFIIDITEPNDNFLDILRFDLDKWKMNLQKNVKNIKINLFNNSFQYYFKQDLSDKFDITLSNFAYHWVENFHLLFAKYSLFSRYHIFTVPIIDSLGNLKNILMKHNIAIDFYKLPSMEDILYAIKSNKVPQQYKLSQTFDSIFDILKFFQKSGFTVKSNIYNNFKSLRMIKMLIGKCKMEFIYVKVAIS